MGLVNWFYRRFDGERQAVIDRFNATNSDVPPALDGLLIAPVKAKKMHRLDKYTEQLEYEHDDDEYDDSEYELSDKDKACLTASMESSLGEE